MIDEIITRLQQVGLDLTAEEVADILWLGVHMERAMPTGSAGETDLSAEDPDPTPSPGHRPSPRLTSLPTSVSGSATPAAAKAYLSTPASSRPRDLPAPSRAVAFKTPDASALRNPLVLARALRPLMQKVPSRTQMMLDEEATVTRIADEALWVPVLQPAEERWFSLVLVIEEAPSVAIWQKAIREWGRLIKHHGAFRDVRTWYLRAQGQGEGRLFPQRRSAPVEYRPRSGKELLEPGGRQLILLVSDCVSPLWQQGHLYSLLESWTQHSSVSILQLMPERYWERSVLGRGRSVQFRTLSPGPLSAQLKVRPLPVWETPLQSEGGLKLPVITFDPTSLAQWARVMTGNGTAATAGIVFESAHSMAHPRPKVIPTEVSPAEQVRCFRANASLPARQLATLMAVAPVSLPVARLIQQTMVPNSGQIHLAEVFLSGLLHVSISAPIALEPDQIPYDFAPGVRDLLLQAIPLSEADEVLDRVSDYIARRAGLTINSFDALLELYDHLDAEARQQIAPFAELTPQVLRRLGGIYAEIADELATAQSRDRLTGAGSSPVSLQTMEFEVVTVTFENGPSSEVEAIAGEETTQFQSQGQSEQTPVSPPVALSTQEMEFSQFSRFMFTAAGISHDVYYAGSGPAILMLHDISGLTVDHFAFAGRLIAAGHTVYLPLLFGQPNVQHSTLSTLGQATRMGLGREFALFARNQSGPITQWLKPLCHRVHQDVGGGGIAVIGMSMTGGLVIPLMAESVVQGAVALYPSLPFGLSGANKAALGVSDQDIAAAKVRMAEGVRLLACRFSNDNLSPPERFDTLRQTFGNAPDLLEHSAELHWTRANSLECLEINSDPGNPAGLPQNAHSLLPPLLAGNYEPVNRVFFRILTFLQEQLVDPDFPETEIQEAWAVEAEGPEAAEPQLPEAQTEKSSFAPSLQTFEFETVIVDAAGHEIERAVKTAQSYVEVLGSVLGEAEPVALQVLQSQLNSVSEQINALEQNYNIVSAELGRNINVPDRRKRLQYQQQALEHDLEIQQEIYLRLEEEIKAIQNTESIILEMVAIPGGTFLMGSPEDEIGHEPSEEPQHEVTVPDFFIGKYPVTQAQWKFVAELSPVEQELNPDPARFKGDHRPVENVSWYEATEFCARLSRLTGREYRLPTEAEWEYACRAGTQTPFAFGETLTADLANYYTEITFAEEARGQWHQETTPAGYFLPNGFGLYDMHGNVWEWCLDRWRENYADAPINIQAMLSLANQDQEYPFESYMRGLRGGSWNIDPAHCRSACRYTGRANLTDYLIGFRVCCSATPNAKSELESPDSK